jgi:hypothetical protein
MTSRRAAAEPHVRRQPKVVALFFADLTPYEYGCEEPRSNVLNVGWLSRQHPFPTGGVSESFVNVLRRLVASPVNLYRGYHICEFCPGPREFLSPTGLRTIDPPKDTMGNGEIRVVGPIGLVYVAPTLSLTTLRRITIPRPQSSYKRSSPSMTSQAPNKQLQRTVTRRRGRGACAPLHYAHAPRITQQRADAELQR